MSRWVAICALLLTAMACEAEKERVLSSCPPPPQAPVGPERLAELEWFSGCWTGDVQAGEVEECWTVPKGDSSQVTTRTVSKEGKTVSRKFISIDGSADGIVMTVQHFGPRLTPEDKAVEYRMVKMGEYQLVFENPKNDFPQRILYQQLPDDSVIVRIEQMDGSKAEEFRMRRSMELKPAK
jgi:hypothetical protein